MKPYSGAYFHAKLLVLQAVAVFSPLLLDTSTAFLMNECMKKKLSTQTSKEEGNRSLLSKPSRRIYNTPPRVQRRRRSLLSPQIGNDIENHGVKASTHSFPLLTIHIRAFTSSKWANQGLPLAIFIRSQDLYQSINLLTVCKYVFHRNSPILNGLLYELISNIDISYPFIPSRFCS